MKRSSTGFIPQVAAALAMLIGTTACGDRPSEQAATDTPAQAQPAGSIPRLPDGKPDMTGVWGQDGFGGDYGLADLEAAYTPEARAQQEKLGEADDPLFRCLPYGVPRVMLASPWPFQIVHRPGMMVVLTEYYHAYRLIPTDGGPHAPDVLPTYFGDSAARWEGDTLVVDVIGFNGKTWLGDARDRPTPASRGVWIHSDAMHVVERWRLVDADTLEYRVVVEDPKMLTKPWTPPVITKKRQPFQKIGEGMCTDTTTYDLARQAGR